MSACVYGFWLAKHNLFLARRFRHCLIDRHLLAWLYSSMTHIRPLFDLEMTSDPFPFRFTQLIDNLEFCQNGNSILISIHDSRSRSKKSSGIMPSAFSCWRTFMQYVQSVFFTRNWLKITWFRIHRFSSWNPPSNKSQNPLDLVLTGSSRF